MKHQPTSMSRRRFIGQSACSGLGLSGLLSTLGTLRLFNATLSAQGGLPADDSKALICLFLFGGNDSNNTLVPRDLPSYNAYQTDRGILALSRDSLLPIANPGGDGREFGLHPAMAPLLPVYNAGDMAILCNVGTLVAPITKAEYLSGGAAIPPHLFSHNDQQVQWQTSVPDSPKKVGWGGRIADLLQGLNAGADISMNVSIAGSNFFQVGDQVLQYHVTPQGSIGLDGTSWNWSPWMEMFPQNTQMLNRSYGHAFEQEYANIMKRGISNDALLKNQLAANPLPAGVGTFPNSLNGQGQLNRVAAQLRMILRMIHARQGLNMKRQIFFAALGGFDTHDAQLDDHAALLLELSTAIADFHTHTTQLGIADKVTLFTASDFNRTYNSNGKGSDHAWGGHHLIVGGALNGGRLYGDMPILQIQGPDDTGTRGSWIPKVSTDEMSATLARWFGVSENDLPLVLPNIGRFSRTDLGFMQL
jgi:uncharacterized protein (DUF1501 family)